MTTPNWISDQISILSLRTIRLIVATLSLLIIPPVFMLLSPLYFIRQLVKFLAKKFCPDLAKMLTCTSASIACASNTLDKPRVVLLLTVIFKGKVGYSRIKELVQTRLLEAENSAGELRFPELQQSLTSWLGYSFWKQDKSFEIENHVKIKDFDKKNVSAGEIKSFETVLIGSGFPKDRSPWEIVVVNNFVSQNSEDDQHDTALIFRTSHILTDGYAIMEMGKSLFEVKESVTIKPHYPRRSILQMICFPFDCFYVLATILVDNFRNFPFKVSESAFKDRLDGPEIIPVSVIKGIKNEFGVSFTSAIISLGTGALRSMALDNKVSVPKTIPCLIPMPRPCHPLKLRNHYTLGSIDLPIGESDPIQRVQLCHKEYERMKSSAYPVVAYYSLILSGGCFKSLGRLMGRVKAPAVSLSYIPSGWEECYLDGHELKQYYVHMSPSGSIGFVGTILCYRDRVSFNATFDGGIFSGKEGLGFKRVVKQEVDILTKVSSSFHDV